MDRLPHPAGAGRTRDDARDENLAVETNRRGGEQYNLFRVELVDGTLLRPAVSFYFGRGFVREWNRMNRSRASLKPIQCTEVTDARGALSPNE